MPAYSVLIKLGELYKELKIINRRTSFIAAAKNGTSNSFLRDEAIKEFYFEKKQTLLQWTIAPMISFAISLFGLGSSYPIVALIFLFISLLWFFALWNLHDNVQNFYKVPDEKLSEYILFLKNQIKKGIQEDIKRINESLEITIPNKKIEYENYLNSTAELITQSKIQMQEYSQILFDLDLVSN